MICLGSLMLSLGVGVCNVGAGAGSVSSAAASASPRLLTREERRSRATSGRLLQRLMAFWPCKFWRRGSARYSNSSLHAIRSPSLAACMSSVSCVCGSTVSTSALASSSARAGSAGTTTGLPATLPLSLECIARMAKSSAVSSFSLRPSAGTPQPRSARAVSRAAASAVGPEDWPVPRAQRWSRVLCLSSSSAAICSASPPAMSMEASARPNSETSCAEAASMTHSSSAVKTVATSP
mmetsp:Transcript_116041/g.339292  ORF Transcript_116041/g.339292 Transcript_116041/m.339292 type:complete len:237 (-) Transcript_116041:300-1010(-)